MSMYMYMYMHEFHIYDANANANDAHPAAHGERAKVVKLHTCACTSWASDIGWVLSELFK